MKKLIISAIFATMFVSCQPLYKRSNIIVNTLKTDFALSDATNFGSKITEWVFINNTDSERANLTNNQNTVAGVFYTTLKPCKVFGETHTVILKFQYYITNNNGNCVVIVKNPLITYKPSHSLQSPSLLENSVYVNACNTEEEIKTKMLDFCNSIKNYLNE